MYAWEGVLMFLYDATLEGKLLIIVVGGLEMQISMKEIAQK